MDPSYFLNKDAYEIIKYTTAMWEQSSSTTFALSLWHNFTEE